MTQLLDLKNIDVNINTKQPSKVFSIQNDVKKASEQHSTNKDIILIQNCSNDIIPKVIFRAYDIRGEVGVDLNAELARKIGYAFGCWLSPGALCAVGRDGRLSSQELSQALIDGLNTAGVNVLNLGMVTTPMTYFATHAPIDSNNHSDIQQIKTLTHFAQSAIMVTGSHNPANYNGFKMVLNGVTVYGEKIQELYEQIVAKTQRNIFNENQNFIANQGKIYHASNLNDVYQAKILDSVHLERKIKIAIDCGNGIPGKFAATILRALDCEVIELYCDVDGNFPNHHPDPANPKNLQDLLRCVRHENCELGLAFDGDGDRLGVVTNDGQIIFPDRLLMLLAKDVLEHNPGAEIIYDVKCTAKLAPWITQHGGKPLMWKTGHSFIKAKLRECKAHLAGEMSGHIFFNDRWYGFDDALYAASRLLEILSRTKNASCLLNSLPNSVCTPELYVDCSENEAQKLLHEIKEEAHFSNYLKKITIDGLRVEYADGFGLIRASNTTPMLMLRFEADNSDALTRIAAEFKQAILKLKPETKIAF